MASFWKKILLGSREEKNRQTPKPKAKKELVVAAPGVRTEISKGKIIPGIIRLPHITEKTAGASTRENKYTFVVAPTVNKIMVKRAIETKYGVAVNSVNMLATPGKVRTRGRQVGFRPGFKKAVVTVQKGHTIEVS